MAMKGTTMNRRRLFCLPLALLAPLMPREQKRKWMRETENPNWGDYEILWGAASKQFKIPGEWFHAPGVKFDL
jgi:hypothetical protein